MRNTLSILVIGIVLVFAGCSDNTNSESDSSAVFNGDLTTLFPEKVSLRPPVHFPDMIYVHGELTFTRTSVYPTIASEDSDSLFRIDRPAASADYKNPVDQPAMVHVAVVRLNSTAEAKEKLASYQGNSRYSAWTKGNLLFKVTVRSTSREYPPTAMPDFKF